MMAYSPKRLDKVHMDKLQALEKKLGRCVVAWEKAPRAAELSESQLKELQELEKEMNAILVAYDCKL
jgi:hypothetical protein